MSRLLSVNVGVPQEIEWQGKRVRTAIWNSPISRHIRARPLNLDGDGQADLQGHGGEQRAVPMLRCTLLETARRFLQSERAVCPMGQVVQEPVGVG
jgi:MOSC domain-containing protein YiiM